MPLPADEKVVQTSKDVISTFKGLFGEHPGYRPAHAKGVLLKGTFTPTAKAGELSKAQHFTSPSTPVIARFSSGTGIPALPDTDPNGNPRGLALRFMLAETPRRVHTDIVAHSVPFFPAATPDEALAFFQSIAAGTVGEHVASHPAAQAFVAAPKRTPKSFGQEPYYSVSAFKLVAADGKGTFVKYTVAPAAGEAYLDEAELEGKGANFLYDGVAEALKAGPIRFHLKAQVAQEGDVTDDNTKHWPDDREVVDLGLVSLEALMEDQEKNQKYLIFDPVPRVAGVEPSADPLLDLRAGIYLLSGRERRAA